MKIRSTLITVALAFTPMAAFAASAAPVNPILAANSEVGIGFVQQQSNYSENIPGVASDVENGSMPGFDIFAKDNFNLFGVNNLYASVKYTRISGDTNYSDGSFTEQAQHVTNDVNVKLGKTLFLGSDSAVTPYVFGGYHNWYRAVPGGSGDPENYSNGYVGLGGMFQYAPTEHLVLAASGGVGELIGSSLNATTNPIFADYGFQVPDQVNFNLASRPYYTLGVSADYRVQKHFHLIADAGYTDFMYGGSSVQTFQGSGYSAGYILGFQEPSSQTSNFTVGLSMAYGF